MFENCRGGCKSQWWYNFEMLMERNKDALINAGFPYDIDTDSFMWDPSDSSNKQAWSDLSALYATQASGNVHIVAGDNVTKESVWITRKCYR